GVGAGGIAWAISELDLAPVYLNFAENSHLMVTGRRECGRTTTTATTTLRRTGPVAAHDRPTPPQVHPSSPPPRRGCRRTAP
ncbi:hypothetical protein, partial [Mycobacterium tuberculosis]|uniref:hypothetical protein n=1 Tax=Mycobacterium tuberculosis TaxID=1773 RepID=UPI003C6E7CF3